VSPPRRASGTSFVGSAFLKLEQPPVLRIHLQADANLPEHPGSVPVNRLVKVAGTPLESEPAIEPLEFVRTIAVARLLMPRAYVRLSAGRDAMSDELQALCFFAGANSIFYGEKLLTTGNPDTARDDALFGKLGLHPA
jgi:biotin synthase